MYDLYCGVGLIGLYLAGQARTVFGVESDPQNVEAAERSAALNGLSNATFLCGKAEDLLKGKALFRMGAPPDRLILDPPRVGLHKEIFGPLLEAAPPKILYLSCNPSSLAHDLRIILERDPSYRIGSLQMFDFFPHTPHMEVLAALSRSAI